MTNDPARHDDDLQEFLWNPEATPVDAVSKLAARLTPLRCELDRFSAVDAIAIETLHEPLPPTVPAASTDPTGRQWLWAIGAMAAAAAVLLFIGLGRRPETGAVAVGPDERPVMVEKSAAQPARTVARRAGSAISVRRGPSRAPAHSAPSTQRRAAPVASGAPASSSPPATMAAQPADGVHKRTAADIRKGIGRYRSRVQNRCWKPRAGSKSTRVTLQLTILPAGSTSNVSASGGHGYPGLAGCVAGDARSWRFGPADKSTTVTFPFHFAGNK